MGYKANSPIALEAIFANVLNLHSEAVNLSRCKKFGGSVHFSIACLEECSKYLIVYCRQHLPPEIFKRRFQHLSKHKISHTFYFIAGQIDVFYNLERIQRKATGGIKSALTSLLQLAPYMLDRGDPERTAAAIMEIASKNADKSIELQRMKAVSETEHNRTASICVDIGDNLEIKSTPKNFSLKECMDYIERSRVSIAVLKFIWDPSLTAHRYVSMLPSRFRKEIEHSARTKTEQLLKTVIRKS